jgi:hypothetical protein
MCVSRSRRKRPPGHFYLRAEGNAGSRVRDDDADGVVHALRNIEIECRTIEADARCGNSVSWLAIGPFAVVESWEVPSLALGEQPTFVERSTGVVDVLTHPLFLR